MPTPGGLLKAGDRLTHDAYPGVTFEIVTRTGTDKTYAVWFRRTDGQPVDWRGIRRDHNRQAMLTEAHYWVFETSGGWHLCQPYRQRGGPLRPAGPALLLPAWDSGELVDHLRKLDRRGLRRLAWEALQIADGPDRIDGPVAGALVGVESSIRPGGGQQFRVWLEPGSASPDPAWPVHYRDGDGPLCEWSGRPRRGQEACPRGCSGSTEHYANDGHPGCDDAEARS